ELDSKILVLELKKEKDDLIKQIQSNNFQLESEVSKRKEELAATNERLFEGLRYAKKIQKSILSDRRILKDVFSDVMIFYKPLDIVSGDFYFFKRIGNKVIIAAFDCTGHGVPGAILSMLGSSTLDNLVTGQVSRPSQLLIAVNNKLHEVLNSEGETNDGMDGCILLYNLDTQKLSYCGANSSMIYFINGERIRVRGNRLSLGDNYIAEDQNVNQENFDAREISSIYLFSDGFKDQINASCTEKFNTKRFNDLLSQIHTEDFENQKEMLGDELSRWRGSTHQVDDIMILGFKMFAQ
ncbi:MAG: SpoIIE family protein phosphatase, partial [Bacteroidota bacterium]